jgi:hypothetical protein
MTFVLIGGFAVVYVSNTILYLTPPNPVKLQLAPIIYGLQHPLFSQDWRLFAPHPIKTNFGLAVRCRTIDGVTPWYDPFTPLLAAHHRNRFTPMGKVSRIPRGAIFAFMGQTTDEWRPLICKRAPDLAVCRGDDADSKKQRELGAFLLARLGSASCDQLAGSGRTIAVQLRILIHTPPPFSKRHLPSEEGSTRYVPLPWLPYQPWNAADSREGYR